ncbi:MAG: EAL domain-containing protein [Actinomycetota bacterium]
MSFLKRSVLALRTLLWVVLVSLGVFVVASTAGVLLERDRILTAAHDEAHNTVANNLGAVGVALWSYDKVALSALLEGMVRGGSMTRFEVRDDQDVVADVRRPGTADNADRVWSVPILAQSGGKQIGVLRVFESYGEVDKRIADAVTTLVAAELVKVIGLAFIIFVIVYRQIARHLHHLAEDVQALAPKDLETRISLDRRHRHRDELDTLVESINRFLHDRAEEMKKRSRAESSLRESMTEMQVVLGALSDGVIALDGECRVRYANAAARALLGMLSEPVEGQGMEDILAIVSERSGREIEGLCARILEDGTPMHLRGDVRIRTRDGSEFDAKISAVPAPGSGDVAMILVFTDISAEISKERQIEFQAFHDPLTELGNRSMLARDLGQDIERASREGGRIAILSLDLDNFKNINDALGHTVGDILLKQLAHRLRATVKAPGWVTRHGGDEFIVVLPQCADINQAIDLARALMASIAQPFFIEEHELRITSSIGICLYPEHGVSIGELISKADMAMYEAKREGRNAYRFYELNLLQRSAERLAMENGLRVALAENQFHLVFQPKVTIAGEEVHSLEALLRWQKRPGETISPADFIPVAEDTGLIIEIGDWVLRESLAAARRLRETLGRDLAIAVNVSPIQFRSSERLMNTLRELAAEEPDLHRLLEIELTESALGGKVDEVTAKLDSIKSLGLKIAIDDFGTGYSSLAYLKNFPIDILKIDQAFIRGLHTNAQDKAIVGSVVQLGKSLGFEIVAEGVEEEAHVAILAGLGCDYAQGYWFSRPLPEGDLAAKLREIEAHAPG